jgi:prepilin-type N-terminal cleavage/methylation domain-containing protein
MLSTDNGSFHNNKHLGFTLLEMLLAVAIMGTIAMLVSYSISNGRQKAQDASRVGDLKILANALELYRSDHFGKLPAIIDSENAWSDTLEQLGKYLPEGALRDPDSSRTGADGYVYCTDKKQNSYLLTSHLTFQNQSDSVIGNVTSYFDEQCLAQDGLVNDLDPCGQIINGLYIYCLGKL